MKKMLKRLTALMLALALVAGQVVVPTSAEEEAAPSETPTVVEIDIPTVSGGETNEKVEVTVTVTNNDNGTETAKAETPEGGDTTDSGLTVEVESIVVTDTEGNDDASDDKIVSENTTYKVEGETVEADGTVVEYTAEGGTDSDTVVNEAQEGDEVTVDLTKENEDGETEFVDQATAGGKETTVITPTDKGDKTQEKDPANFDQTAVTTTEREVEVEVKESTTVSGDAGFVDENGEIIYYDENGNKVEANPDEGYNWYYSGNKGFVGTGYRDPEFGKTYGDLSVWYAVDAEGNKRVLTAGDISHKKATNSETGETMDSLYCMDASTGFLANYVDYRITNLEDADYINDEDAAHIRGIMLNGYNWGGEDELQNLKSTLTELKTNGTDAEKALLANMDIENLNTGDAAFAMNMAIWHYGNQFELNTGEELQVEIRGSDKLDDASKERRMQLYNYLITLTEEAPEDEKQIINEEKFIEDMSFTVGTKVEDHADNQDDDSTNDVYNTSLKFSMVVTPDEETDDLIVKVVDAKGNVVKAARIAGENKEDDTQYEDAKKVIENGKTYYILEGMQLSENQNTTFNLKLEGTQLLKEGVYVFESEQYGDKEAFDEFIKQAVAQGKFNGTGEDYKNMLADDVIKRYAKNFPDATQEEIDAAIAQNLAEEIERINAGQSMVGIFCGTAEVSVTTQIDMTFNVEEETVTTTRTWRTEEKKASPAPAPISDEDGGVEEEAPVQPAPRFRGDTTELKELDNVLLTIEEEEVPLAVAPITGDESAVWGVVSAAAVAAWFILGIKRKHV